MNILEHVIETQPIQPQPDRLLVDGAALIYSLQSTAFTFEYAEHDFIKKIRYYAHL